MPKAEDLLMTAEVAHVLKRDVRTVHRMVQAERISATRVPGYRGPLLFDPAEVERVRRELQGEAGAPPGQPAA